MNIYKVGLTLGKGGVFMAQAGQKFDLEQMQDYFEVQAGKLRCIGDYQLSESDYKSLGAKLKTLMIQEANFDWLHEFILPITIYATYSYIYVNPDGTNDLSFCEVQSKLSQYQMRMHLRNMLECIHDCGFFDYGYKKYDLETACRMTVARNAGIPNDEKYQIFELISSFSGVMEFDAYIEEVGQRLPTKTKRIFAILDQESRREVAYQIRELMAECKNNRNREDVLAKFPHLSVSLIDYCMFWSENQRGYRKIES